MPIYAYKCDSCGFAKDVLQKMSDPLLSECPSCGKSTFSKQLTAAGFQLKGSGWYATDFKGVVLAAPQGCHPRPKRRTVLRPAGTLLLHLQKPVLQLLRRPVAVRLALATIDV